MTVQSGAIVDALADAGLYDLDDSADERARSVVLATVASGVVHVPDFGFVEMREFVFLSLRAELQFVNVVEDVAQIVAALNLGDCPRIRAVLESRRERL